MHVEVKTPLSLIDVCARVPIGVSAFIARQLEQPRRPPRCSRVSFKAGAHVLHHVRPRRMPDPQHAHMLRARLGYALANKGIDTQNPAGLSRPSFDQLDHALCRVAPGLLRTFG